MEEYSWVELGGVRLDGAPTDSPYRGLGLSRLVNWRGLSGSRGEGDLIPGGHGSFASPDLLREPKSMELRGVAVGVDSTDASVLLGLLETACAERIVSLRVSGDDGIWSRVVEVLAFTPDEAWNRPVVKFALDLIAHDPIRYLDQVTVGPVGLPTRTGGLVLPSAFPWHFGTESREVVTVTNSGTVPLLPRIIVTGSASAIVVRGGPYRVEFGAFDGVLIFDSLERRAWLDGTDVTRQLIRRDWPAIDSGVSAEFSFEAVSPSADLSLSVEYRIGVW